MIKLENMTPEVYYKQSRDFQFIGRLYDIVLNSVKTNIDVINNLPINNSLDNGLSDLLTLTLGFKSKHNYSTQQLLALGTAFSIILREKGTKKAIQTAIGVLLNAEGIIDDLRNFDDYLYVDMTNYNIDIYISSKLSDFSLLNDMLEYILPAGMTYRLIKGLHKKFTVWTEVELEDYVTVSKTPIYDVNCTNIKYIPNIVTAEIYEQLANNNIISVEPSAPDDEGRINKLPGIFINSTSVIPFLGNKTSAGLETNITETVPTTPINNEEPIDNPGNTTEPEEPIEPDPNEPDPNEPIDEPGDTPDEEINNGE